MLGQIDAPLSENYSHRLIYQKQSTFLLRKAVGPSVGELRVMHYGHSISPFISPFPSPLGYQNYEETNQLARRRLDKQRLDIVLETTRKKLMPLNKVGLEKASGARV